MPIDEIESFDNDFGLDEDDRKAAKSNRNLDWFKGTKGETYRVALVYFHTHDVTGMKAAQKAAKQAGKPLTPADLKAAGAKALADYAAKLGKSVDALTDIERLDITQVQFKKFTAHYKDGLGFVLSRLGKDGPEQDKVWKQLPEPKDYFSCVILQYPTHKDGSIDKDRIPSGLKVLPWRFAPDRYDEIWKMNSGLRENGLSIASQDILLECNNTDFQNFKFSVAGPAIWQKSDKFKELVLGQAIPLYPKLIPFREMTTGDLAIKLGVSTGAQGTDVGAGDFSDVIDRV